MPMALGPWGLESLEWQHAQIRQVTSLGSTAQHVSVAGKDCLAGGMLNFGVRDRRVFNDGESRRLT
jgi:hypothetical protein